MSEQNFALDHLELGGFETMVNIPSYDVQGEIRMTDFIEQCLREADVRIISLPLGDSTDEHSGRRVLIAEKGSQDAEFTLMFYTHVDAVRPPASWANPHFHRREGKIYGNAAWDMKYKIPIMISLAHTARVPKGMNVRFAFCPDEEKTSKGAHKLLAWNKMKETDLVISGEIPGDVPQREPGAPMRFVTKRRGVVKMTGEIWREERGHGSRAGVNAIREFSNANVLVQRYQKQFIKESGGTHPILGHDELREAGLMAPKSKYQNTKRRLSFDMNANVVPTARPRSFEDILRTYQDGFERIARARKWAANGIHHSLTRVDDSIDPSYLPYDQSSDHELFLPVREAIRNVCHPDQEATETPGIAWGDQNLFVAKGIPCFEVFADGSNCHDSNEWVCEEDIGKIREVFRHCIEQAFLPIIEKQRHAA